jgi:ABC-type amino acid transport substrate-binding protein
LVEFPNRQEGIAALARGDLDGFARDKLVLLALAQAVNLHDVTLLPEDLSFEPFAIMLPRGVKQSPVPHSQNYPGDQ